MTSKRKRLSWKKEMIESFTEAAKVMGHIADEDIILKVRAYRKD